MKIVIALAVTLLAALSGAAVAQENPVVDIQTSKGTIVLELFADKAPKSVENFLSYAREGFYDDTIFHRVIDGFMIQGGGYTADMQLKPIKGLLENEADNGLKNDRGTVAMARKNEPHTASCQFFINTVDNDFLNHTAPTPRGWGYAVFGRVIEGMDVVDAIATVRTAPGDRPVETVAISSVTERSAGSDAAGE